MVSKFLQSMVVFAYVLVSVMGVVAFAQDGTDIDEALLERGAAGFRLSPTREDLEIERGTSQTQKITVRNVTSVAQTARPVIDDFGPSSDESGSPNLLIGEAAVENYKYSIKPFIGPLETLTLDPAAEAELDVTYSIPDDTPPGSYYGVVRFVSNSEAEDIDEGEAGVTLNAAVGLVVLIDVPGETVDLLNLVDASVLRDGQSGSLFSSPPNSYAIRLKNEGNTFQAPFGRVAITDWSGNIVHEYELNSETPRGNVLPDSIRRFENPIENIGSFGRYEVEANISYGDGSNIITINTVFWVIPWTQIILVAIGVIAIAFLATRGLKAYNKRVVEQSKGTRVKKK